MSLGVWTLTGGSDTVLTSDPATPSPLDLGNFSQDSSHNRIDRISYAARGIKNFGPQSGSVANKFGSTSRPFSPTNVPEPASLALMMGLGLEALGFTRRRMAASAT